LHADSSPGVLTTEMQIWHADLSPGVLTKEMQNWVIKGQEGVT